MPHAIINLERHPQNCRRLIMLSLGLLLSAVSPTAWASTFSTDLDMLSCSPRFETLRAAKLYGNIHDRSDDFFFGREIGLIYSHDWTQREQMYSYVHLESDRPTLLLENFDHLLQEVNCHESTMSIVFKDSEIHCRAKDVTKLLVGGILVSSHHTCSE
jgi:hypothetical protein